MQLEQLHLIALALPSIHIHHTAIAQPQPPPTGRPRPRRQLNRHGACQIDPARGRLWCRILRLHLHATVRFDRIHESIHTIAVQQHHTIPGWWNLGCQHRWTDPLHPLQIDLGEAQVPRTPVQLVAARLEDAGDALAIIERKHAARIGFRCAIAGPCVHRQPAGPRLRTDLLQFTGVDALTGAIPKDGAAAIHRRRMRHKRDTQRGDSCDMVCGHAHHFWKMGR